MSSRFGETGLFLGKLGSFGETGLFSAHLSSAKVLAGLFERPHGALLRVMHAYGALLWVMHAGALLRVMHAGALFSTPELDNRRRRSLLGVIYGSV